MTVLPLVIWEKLSKSLPHGQSLSAQIAAPSQSDQLLAALDSNGRRHFLIATADVQASLIDKQSRGLQVETRDLILSGSNLRRYVDIVCVDPSGHDLFQLIGGELADRLNQNDDPLQSVRQVLAKWRRFWGQLPKDILSRNEQIGLFAEIWFLINWMVPAFGTLEAVCRWRGPLHSRHDFEWSGVSVEVKATTTVGAVLHRINGIEQLLPPEDGVLYFYSAKLREEGGAQCSLPYLVAECQCKFEENAEAQIEFEARLLKAGYSPAHEEEYARLRLRLVQESLFEVRDEFPRLTPCNLVNGVPSGVENVNYEISICGLDGLAIGRDWFIRKWQ